MPLQWIFYFPRWLLIASLLCCASAGCENTARSLSVDEGQAREACTTFLTAWKEGKRLADIESEIIGGDFEWHNGLKLVTFEFLPGEHNDGANMHFPIRLTLQNGKGGESKSDVKYTVSTAPAVTVFRE